MTTYIDSNPDAPPSSALAERLASSVVEIRSASGSGAGVIWGDSGLVVTNAHCVDEAAPLQVSARRGLRRAELIAVARDQDLALVRVPGLAARALELRDPRSLRIGELVFAHGHPLGVTDALAMGVVNSVATDARTGAPRYVIADVRLAPGNSGGPLVDAQGRLIGINSMVVNGLGVAIPTNAIVRFIQRVRAARAA